MKPAMVMTAALLLAACGGGGGGGSSARPAPPSSAIPPPAPPEPTPRTNFDTEEYRRSGAAAATGALAAWTKGIEGKGVTVGIIDTGIDTASPEFSGRIHSASRDVTGAGRPVTDADGHGTAVAAVLAASRNDQGIVGVAPAATLAVMRTDRVGTCPDCAFGSADIATGVLEAVAAGARAINISLGGGGSSTMDAAFAEAGRAGVVLVIGAGNDGAASIDPLPAAALSVAGRTTLVVGSVGPTGEISEFSNRAGAAADSWIAAPGEKVVTPGLNGQLFLYSGTSIAAPMVSGAIALLAQNFTNLSAEQLVDLVLRTARDAGAPGTDPVYGRGVLDIAAAMAPVGATSIAGTPLPISLTANGAIGAAFGDGMARSLGQVGIADSYGRRYWLPLGNTLRAAGPGRLAGRLAADTLVQAGTGLASGPFSVALTLRADRETLVHGGKNDGLDAHAGNRNPLRQTRLTLVAGGFALTAATGRLAGETLPGSHAGGLVATDAFDHFTADAAVDGRKTVSAEFPLGAARLAVAAETSEDHVARHEATSGGHRIARRSRMAAALGVPAGPLQLSARIASERERGAFLGTRLSPAFGLIGGHTLEAGAAADFSQGPFDLRLAASQGWHQPELTTGGLLRPAGDLQSRSWSVLAGYAAPFGYLHVAIAQPRALTGGDFGFAAGDDRRFVSVAPDARERALELGYHAGPLEVTLFHRANAGHRAHLDDRGGAVRWGVEF
ncbi:MAG: S8 family peptidase [Sphingomonadaceae bacterium]